MALKTAWFPFKLLVAGWSLVENFLFAGLRAGWPALVYVFKEERIYQHLCTNVSSLAASDTPGLGADGGGNVSSHTAQDSNPRPPHAVASAFSSPDLDCTNQDTVFNQSFAISSAFMSVASLMYGELNFRYGIRVPRLLSLMFFTSGCLCLAFVTVDLPWLIFPGLILISTGGNALYITNSQISYYFTTGAVAVIGLECGALQASSFILNVVKIAYENGFSLRDCFMFIGGLYCMTLISTFVWLPRKYIMYHDQLELDTQVDKMTTEGSDSDSVDTDGSAMNDFEKSVESCWDENANTDLGLDDITADMDIVISTYISRLNEILKRRQKRAHKNSGIIIQELKLNNANDGLFTSDQYGSVVKESYKAVKETTVFNMKFASAAVPATFLPGQGDKAVSYDTFSNTTDLFVEKSGSKSQMDKKNAEQPGVWQSILSPTFLLYLFWASVVELVLSTSLGLFNPWLEFVLDSDQQKVSQSTDILLYSMLASPLISLLFGLAMDTLQLWHQDRRSYHEATLLSSAMFLGVTSLLCILVCSLFMVQAAKSVALTSLALVLFRNSLYSCGTGFLRIMYHTKVFGILIGVMALTSGGFAFLQYPLFLYIQGSDGAWTEAFGLLVVLAVMSVSQPLYLCWRLSQHRKQ